MIPEEVKGLYRAAEHKWGVKAQTLMLMEEVGEGLTAISRYYRGRGERADIVEEMVDIVIMAEQIALVHDVGGKYQEIRERKLTWLRDRLH